jgi:hypothetical protein
MLKRCRLTLAPSLSSSIIKSMQTAALHPCAYKRGLDIPSLTTPSILPFPRGELLIVFLGKQTCSRGCFGEGPVIVSIQDFYSDMYWSFPSLAWPSDFVDTVTSLLSHQRRLHTSCRTPFLPRWPNSRHCCSPCLCENHTCVSPFYLALII